MSFDVKKVHTDLVRWIKDWFADKGNAPVVMGLSGGKDSTICAKLLTEALGKERVIGVLMPNGEQKDISDSYKVCEILGIKPNVVNIADAYNGLTNQIRSIAENGKPFPTPLYSTNTPARLRMTTLYGVAAIYGGFVVNTCNLSESVIGWETYGGDGFGDFSPIGLLTKTEVVELGLEMKLPKELVNKTPSDGMCGESDEDKFGFTYAILDKFIREGITDKELIEKISSMNKRSHFKHENIHIPTFNPNLSINPILNW